MATPEQLKIARKEALKSPLIGKRGKGAKTIEKEERRRIFDEIVSSEFTKIIKLAKPEYKLDQFIGKSPDKIDLGTLTIHISKEIADKNEIDDTN